MAAATMEDDWTLELEARRDIARRIEFWLVILGPDSISAPYLDRAHRALLQSIEEVER
jgi:hypothetical protein